MNFFDAAIKLEEFNGLTPTVDSLRDSFGGLFVIWTSVPVDNPLLLVILDDEISIFSDSNIYDFAY